MAYETQPQGLAGQQGVRGVGGGFFGLEVAFGLLEEGGVGEVIVGGGYHGILRTAEYVRWQIVGGGRRSLVSTQGRIMGGPREEKKLKITSSLPDGFGQFPD